MKNGLLKLLAAVMAVLLTGGLFAACADKGGEDVKTDPEAVASTSAQTPDETTEEDPFAGINYGGRTFTYLVWKQGISEYYGDDSDGDMIKTSLFRRNSIVSDKLGVELEFIEEPGNSSTFTTFCQTAGNNIKSGAHAYDALACYSRSASLLMMQGSLLNLLDNEYLDFEQTWWPESLVKLNTIGGKLYFSSGDIATSLLYEMMFMSINNDLAKDRGISGVQEKALAGNWTFDYMLEIISNVYTDASGGTTPRDINNTYGLYLISHPQLDIFYLGAGLNYVEIDSDGRAIVSDDIGGDISSDIREKLRKVFWSGNESDGYYSNSGDDLAALSTGKSLLYVINGSRLQARMSQADFSYGILCAPKYNSDQENYYTAVGFPHSMYCIPLDANDPDMSGAVLELTARTSYEEVTPTVFDTAFKYKYSQGAADGQMFDIIRRGVVFDFGRTMFDQMGGDSSGPVRLWRNDITGNTDVLNRMLKTYGSKWTAALDDAIATITNAST